MTAAILGIMHPADMCDNICLGELDSLGSIATANYQTVAVNCLLPSVLTP